MHHTVVLSAANLCDLFIQLRAERTQEILGKAAGVLSESEDSYICIIYVWVSLHSPLLSDALS